MISIYSKFSVDIFKIFFDLCVTLKFLRDDSNDQVWLSLWNRQTKYALIWSETPIFLFIQLCVLYLHLIHFTFYNVNIFTSCKYRKYLIEKWNIFAHAGKSSEIYCPSYIQYIFKQTFFLFHAYWWQNKFLQGNQDINSEWYQSICNWQILLFHKQASYFVFVGFKLRWYSDFSSFNFWRKSPGVHCMHSFRCKDTWGKPPTYRYFKVDRSIMVGL